MTPLPMPLTRGRWFSSAENGQRLWDAAFFSLEMFTTQRCTFSTASTTAVRRESDAATVPAGIAATATTATTQFQQVSRAVPLSDSSRALARRSSSQR